MAEAARAILPDLFSQVIELLVKVIHIIKALLVTIIHRLLLGNVLIAWPAEEILVYL